MHNMKKDINELLDLPRSEIEQLSDQQYYSVIVHMDNRIKKLNSEIEHMGNERNTTIARSNEISANMHPLEQERKMLRKQRYRISQIYYKDNNVVVEIP